MRIALFTERVPAISPGVATTIEAIIGHMPGDLDVIPYRVDTRSLSALCTSQMLERARRDRIDMIHLSACGLPAIVALSVAWRLNVPVVGSFAGDFAFTPLRAWYLRALSNRCQRIFAPSAAASERLAAAGVDSGKIVTLTCLPFFGPAEA